MEEAFRLRYKVYCEEKHFLASADYPNGIEFDEFDDYATHLMVHGRDGSLVGYMRVLDGSGPQGFPMFAHGLTVHEDFQVPEQGQAVEISRMIVRSDYRHEFRSTEAGFHASDLPSPRARNASDLVQLQLLRETYHHAVRQGADWVFAAMEPTLHRKFRMMGMPFGPIGPAADYYGEVRPYAMNLRTMVATLRERFPETLSFFDSSSEDPDTTIVRPGEWSHGQLQLAA
jgi:putative PEP-CTERM/exosortase system-associated acyltransferase